MFANFQCAVGTMGIIFGLTCFVIGPLVFAFLLPRAKKEWGLPGWCVGIIIIALILASLMVVSIFSMALNNYKSPQCSVTQEKHNNISQNRVTQTE